MSNRVNLFKTQPALAKAMTELSNKTSGSSMDNTLKHLVYIYSSQLNHCAFCLDMHVKEAKIDGERELRLLHIPIWRESTLFSEREKIALELTEQLTRLGENGIEDELYSKMQLHFNDDEIGQLIFVIAVINSWNRLMIASNMTPGSLDHLYGLDKANLK
ncbi:carboxymuconolactone decarboxylase family protein [Bartonella sp. HY329]|uniref:carboxymuconolactone decarboxylase family protein n=1 Tax=unclassified Bartonella TaxID=2645622 RepID=UPI0021C77EA2|nr:MULTISPECIES: carboxymuconolactone decarboxylase family protein [unclassified Bartonella]UXM96165.1 carboxymuconolactone decarboxylase family protein [Bartonella sp. HY329]UXN10489.1 carboxymuconolactone decarboxylase family protein [Bartonella sp. HY328]